MAGKKISSMDEVIAHYVSDVNKKKEADSNHNPDDWHHAYEDEERAMMEALQEEESQNETASEEDDSEQSTVSLQDVNEGNVPDSSMNDVRVGWSETLTESEEDLENTEQSSDSLKSDNSAKKWYENRVGKVEDAVTQPVSRSELVEDSVSDDENIKETSEDVDDVPDLLSQAQKKERYQKDVQELAQMQQGSDIGFDPEVLVKPRKSALKMVHDAQSIVRKEIQMKERQAKQMKDTALLNQLEPGKDGALLKTQMSRLKDIPRPLIERIMVEFDGKPKNQTDALVAWVVCHGDDAMIAALAPYLTGEQMSLIAGWEDSPQMELQSKVDELLLRMQKMSHHMDTMELMLAHSSFDRMGFRMEQATSPRSINFLEDGVIDTVLRAEEQTGEMRYERQRQTGRPKK